MSVAHRRAGHYRLFGVSGMSDDLEVAGAFVRLATVTVAAQGVEAVLGVAAAEIRSALGAVGVSVTRGGPDPEYTVAQVGEMSSAGEERTARIRVEERDWGTLTAIPETGAFAAREARLIDAFAGILGAAVARAELHAQLSRLAYEDPLTGLANRRALDERLEAALDADRGDRPVSLVVADVDAFKELNDRHGHDEGDRVLRAVAGALAATAAELPETVVARSGGDEFCAVLLDRPLRDAEAFCRSASHRIGELDGAHVTLAWGAASSADGARRPGELFRAADAAQYAAKRAGRGRICLSGPEAPAQLPVRPARRRLRDAANAERAWLIPAAFEALDSGTCANLLDRLATVAAVFAGALDAAGWEVSSAPAETGVLTCARGELTVLEPESGRRMTRVHMGDEWNLADYPATLRAVEKGTGYFASRVTGNSDPDEVRVLEAIGYDAVLGAGLRREGCTWVVEIFADARTLPFEDVLPHLRAAVAAATAYAAS